MSTRTMLALATVVGGAVAGCATATVDPGEPVMVMDQLTCIEAADLLGVGLGNAEVRIVNPTPGHIHLDDTGALWMTLRPTDDGAHLEWSASMGVYGVIVERMLGRGASIDQVEPAAVTARPFDPRAHVEMSDVMGTFDTALAPRFELYLRDPEIAGPSVLPASLHPRTKAPLDIEAFRVCLTR